MRFNSQHDLDVMGVAQYVPTPGGRGFQFQAMHGRVPHQELTREDLGPIDVPRDVELCRRAMDAMSIDVQVVFPTSLLSLGMSPMPMGESQVAYAYDRWMIEEFCSQDDRLKFLPYLPLNDPDMCLRMINEFAGNSERVRLPRHQRPLRPGARQQVHARVRGDRGDRAAARLPRRTDVGGRLDEDDEPLPVDARDLVRALQHRPHDQLAGQRPARALPASSR